MMHMPMKFHQAILTGLEVVAKVKSFLPQVKGVTLGDSLRVGDTKPSQEVHVHKVS